MRMKREGGGDNWGHFCPTLDSPLGISLYTGGFSNVCQMCRSVAVIYIIYIIIFYFFSLKLKKIK
jgi:hypothetical protein